MRDKNVPSYAAHRLRNSPGVLAQRSSVMVPTPSAVHDRLKLFVPNTILTSVNYARTFGKLRLFLRPKSLNEYILHKKLRKRDPLLTRTADKLLVRSYVAQKIGEEHLIRLLLVADDPRDIEFGWLPKSFMMKATHGSGWVLAVVDKDAADLGELVAVADAWLRSNYYDFNREWALKDVVPRIVVEELLLEDGVPPTDYKFYVFKGRLRLIEVASGRFYDYRENHFDERWRELDVSEPGLRREAPIPRPEALDEMIRIAEVLGADFEIVRIDLYVVRGRVFFGEITHYPAQGMCKWDPPEFDDDLGAAFEHGAPIPERYYMRRSH